jgi:chromosome segregation ATPase
MTAPELLDTIAATEAELARLRAEQAAADEAIAAADTASRRTELNDRRDRTAAALADANRAVGQLCEQVGALIRDVRSKVRQAQAAEHTERQLTAELHSMDVSLGHAAPTAHLAMPNRAEALTTASALLFRILTSEEFTR